MTRIECRLCAWQGEQWIALQLHLQEHSVTRWLGDGLELRQTASKDWPDHSENTFALFEESTLLAVIVSEAERDADDPMRFEGE